MVLKSQVTVSQYQVDKFNGWFIPSTYGPNVNSGVAGKASRDFDKNTNNNLEWVTNFSTRMKDHQIRAMVGYSYNYGVSSGMGAENWDFSSDGLTYNNLGSGLEAAKEGKTMMSSYKNDHKLISFSDVSITTGKSAICLLSLYVMRALPVSVRIINGVISRLCLSAGVFRMRNL